MMLLAWVLIGYGALVLLVLLAAGVTALVEHVRGRRLRQCRSCGGAMRGGSCPTCADRARDHRAMDLLMRSVERADWLEAADAIPDDEPLPAWQGVVRRDREEARERAVLDRRAEEAATAAVRMLWASVGSVRECGDPTYPVHGQ